MDIINFKESMSFFVYGFIELSILFLIISFFVEVLNIYLNPKKVQKLLASNKSGYIIASLLGSITPFCSCSSVPLTLGLIRAKAGFGPIMTFLFTSPLLNPIIVIVFYISFGLKVTLIYSLVALLVSLSAGFVLDKLGFEKYIIKEEKPLFSMKAQNMNFVKLQGNGKEEKISLRKQIFNKSIALKTWKQFISFLPYLAIGIGIGAFVHGFVPSSFISTYAGNDNILAVPFSALVGVPLYIRADMMVGFAPELIEKGVNMGSILALTIAGAGASLPEMIMLKKIFKLPIMVFFVLTVFSMAIVCGYLVNFYFN